MPRSPLPVPARPRPCPEGAVSPGTSPRSVTWPLIASSVSTPSTKGTETSARVLVPLAGGVCSWQAARACPLSSWVQRRGRSPGAQVTSSPASSRSGILAPSQHPYRGLAGGSCRTRWLRVGPGAGHGALGANADSGGLGGASGRHRGLGGEAGAAGDPEGTSLPAACRCFPGRAADGPLSPRQALFALCSMLRHFPYAQQQFLKLGGLQVLRGLFRQKGTEALHVRVVTLLYDLIVEKVRGRWAGGSQPCSAANRWRRFSRGCSQSKPQGRGQENREPGPRRSPERLPSAQSPRRPCPRLLAGAVPASRLALEPSPQPSLVCFPIPWITAANVSLKTALPCHRLLFSLRVSLTPENGN